MNCLRVLSARFKNLHRPSIKNLQRRRKGNILVLSALLMIVMFSMLAFSVDLGYILVRQAEVQRSVDSAALAGAGGLIDGAAGAQARAMEYLVRNPAGNMTAVDENNLQTAIQQFLREHQEDLEMKLGHWDPDAIDAVTGQKGTLIESSVRPSTISVAFELKDQPLFFAKMLGKDKFTVRAEAIASYQPREIMLTLDLSGSMNDDSELRNADSIGTANVVDNLEQIYEELGSPTHGNLQFDPVYISSNTTWYIKYQLGLNNVPYPYPSGSWDDYIYYVRSSNHLYNAGYHKKYGYLTLINYWLERRPQHNQTPDLWKVSAQPITSVKDSVDTFFDYLEAVNTDDRVGLAVYNAQDGEGQLETGLTADYELVKAKSNSFQAGHYHTYTNIGAGLKKSREELDANARAGSFRMIVLLTDGKANWVGGGYDIAAARQFVLDEAQLAADRGYKVMTISLGSGADTELMAQVADITGGKHFNVPGGQSVADYREDLLDVFEDIANRRPLQMVR